MRLPGVYIYIRIYMYTCTYPRPGIYICRYTAVRNAVRRVWFCHNVYYKIYPCVHACVLHTLHVWSCQWCSEGKFKAQGVDCNQLMRGAANWLRVLAAPAEKVSPGLCTRVHVHMHCTRCTYNSQARCRMHEHRVHQLGLNPEICFL